MSTTSSIRTLVLSLAYPNRASYYIDWQDAFDAALWFSATHRNILTLTARRLQHAIEEFDLVVLLHSCTADTTEDLRRLAPALAGRKRARLLAFIGNEFNSPYAPLSDKISVIEACRPDIVATQLLEEAGQYLYADCAPHVMSLPHALNTTIFQPGSSEFDRIRDIGVRTYRYSAWLGDEDRNRIVDYFLAEGETLGLTVDISQRQRLGRAEWAHFLATSRGTISSEAGSWYLQRDDALVRDIYDEMVRERRGLVITDASWIRRQARRLPGQIKIALAYLLRTGPIRYEAFEDDKLDFDDIYARHFANAARCPAYSKTISSRHFDAIGTKTCQIMFPGRFNDILTAGEHYIALEPDFSNIDEVLRRFRDESEHRRMVDAAYDTAMSSHTYAHRIEQIYDALQAL